METVDDPIQVLLVFMASMHEYALECRRRITLLNRGEFDVNEMARQNSAHYVLVHEQFCSFPVKAGEGRDGSMWPSPFDRKRYDAQVLKQYLHWAILSWGRIDRPKAN